MSFYDEIVLVTGVAGFIGSNFIVFMVKKYPNIQFIGIDKISYCSNLDNIKDIKDYKNFKFYKYDLTDENKMNKIFEDHKINNVIHFAAYTHVDNSFGNSIEFTKNNIVATHILLEFSKKNKINKFIYVSTDEVYGSTNIISDEKSTLDPTNPYAATKAASEHLVKSYYYSFKLPIIITRGNNVYGPNQYPDKVIPLFIFRLLNDKKCQIQGSGHQKRSFLYIDDVVVAFDIIFNHGKIGEIYNIGTDHEVSINNLSYILIDKIKHTKKYDDWIEYITDRNINDIRYQISIEKLKLLGWKQETSFDDGLEKTINWCSKNLNLYDNKI